MRSAAVAVRAGRLALSAVVAGTVGGVTSSVVNRAVGLLAFSALFTVGGWLFGLVASTVFRRRIDRVLRREGVA